MTDCLLPRRRDLCALIGTLLAWPALASAQQRHRPRRIGFLRASPPPARVLAAFRRGLTDHGLVEKRDYVIVTGWGDGDPYQLPRLARSLVQAAVEVIVTDGTRSARAAQTVTARIPIVMAGGFDLVAAGLAKSLSRPGGNVTGITTQVIELVGKSFQLLKELVPDLARVAVIAPAGIGGPFRVPDAKAARDLELKITYVDMAVPEGAEDAMMQANAAGAQAAILRGTPFLSAGQRRLIVERAAAHRLPMMFETRDFVDLGGLLSYGADFDAMFGRAADYVARILKGAKPGEMPIEQPTVFQLVVNLKAAKALGLAIRPALLARADQVIE